MFVHFRDYQDVGYPDSATTLCIANYVHTGHLYPDINQPPYYPTHYGPLAYVLLSIPYRLAVHHSYSPDRALRLAVLSFFLGSLALVFLIARRLTGSIKLALLASLFAASGAELRYLPILIRPDMLALSFALLGIWLCLGPARRWQLGLAALCAGAAILCKQSYVAMPTAVFLWLLFERRFLMTLGWAMGVGGTVLAIYGFIILREPLAWQHFAALSHPFLEYREGLRMVWHSMEETKVPFFFFGAWFAWRHRHERAPLVVLYGFAAFFVAVLTIPQAGSNTNYFLEFWAIAAILAAPGLLELNQRLHRTPVIISSLVLVLLLYFFAPKLHYDGVDLLATYRETRDYAQRQSFWERVHVVLAGRRVFSFIPSITLWSNVPEVPDPFVNSEMEMRGTWSSAPIVRNVQEGVYEAMVGDDDPDDFRVVPATLPLVRAAMEQHYARACNFEGFTVWLPMHGAPDLYDQLVQAGCVPMPGH
jgi:hypothetical protein